MAGPGVCGCRLINFLDDEIGWGASIDSLSVTKDGAQSWEQIALPEEVSDIAAISLRTAEAGYLLDFDGTLYSTIDGGQNWSAQTLQFEDGDLALMKLGRPSAAIRFLDEDNGVLILNLAGGGKSELIAMHTADSGQSWERHLLPVELGTVYLSQYPFSSAQACPEQRRRVRVLFANCRVGRSVISKQSPVSPASFLNDHRVAGNM